MFSSNREAVRRRSVTRKLKSVGLNFSRKELAGGKKKMMTTAAMTRKRLFLLTSSKKPVKRVLSKLTRPQNILFDSAKSLEWKKIKVNVKKRNVVMTPAK